MRLLNVSHFFEAHGGGIERVAGHICRRLVAQNHAVFWAASDADALPAHSDITAIPLGCINPTERLTGLPMPIPGPRGVIALWRGVKQADTVVVHDALYVTSIIALLAARFHKRPVILIQHIAALQFTSALMRGIMRLANFLVTGPMLRHADQSVFISASVRDAFNHVALRRPSLLIFNGVDSAVFHNRGQPDEAAVTRQRHGLPTSGPLFFFAGRFVEKKGLAVLREVALARRDATFVFAGAGPIDPGAWQLPNVRVLGGLQPAEIASLMRTTDALLLPSIGEGYPLVVQEALASGLPVICGMDSALADPDAAKFISGIEVDHADVEGTAARMGNAMDALHIPSESRDEMAAYALAAYSWDAMASRLVDAIKAV